MHAPRLSHRFHNKEHAVAYELTQYPTSSARQNRMRGAALLAAAGLAASFLYVRAKARQAEAHNPPAGKFLDVDGIRLHYTERGEGPPLVLLHGNGIMANDFDTSGVAERAAQHYRVIAFDRPGYGYSERPRTTIWTPQAQARLLHKALQQLGVEHPVVLGHSWGSMVALAMALEFPDDMRGLVLMSGYYYPSLRLDAPVLSPPAVPVLGDVLRFTLAPLLGRLMWPLMVRQLFKPSPVPEQFRALPKWMMLRPSQLRASAAESALMVPSALMLSKHYQELKVPIMIIAGSEDAIVDPGHNAGRLHDDLPQSSLRLEPGQGHMLHYADPGEVVNAIDAMQAAHLQASRAQLEQRDRS